MKIFYFIIFIFLRSTYISQEGWTRYPTKDKLDSLKIKSINQEKISNTILEIPEVTINDTSLEKDTIYF